MGTTAEKFNYLNETKGLIKEAIKRKGVTVEDTDTFRSYADKIDNIDTGANLNDYFTDTIDSNGIRASIKKIRKLQSISGTSLQNAFAYCRNLTELDLSSLDTSNVTSLSGCFSECHSLASLNVSTWNTSNVTNISQIFYQVREITELDLSSWDLGKVNTISVLAFYQYGTSKLVNLKFGYDLGKGYLTTASANYNNYQIDVSHHKNLSHDSLMSIINNLYDIATAGVQTQKLVLGATNLAKLSSEEIAIATNKGWNVS